MLSSCTIDILEIRSVFERMRVSSMFHSFLWRCGTFLVECRSPRLLFVGRTCIMNHVLLCFKLFLPYDLVLAIVSHIFASDISSAAVQVLPFASGKLGGSYLELCPQPIRGSRRFTADGSWGSDLWGKASWKNHVSFRRGLRIE